MKLWLICALGAALTEAISVSKEKNHDIVHCLFGWKDCNHGETCTTVKYGTTSFHGCVKEHHFL